MDAWTGTLGLVSEAGPSLVSTRACSCSCGDAYVHVFDFVCNSEAMRVREGTRVGGGTAWLVVLWPCDVLGRLVVSGRAQQVVSIFVCA